MNGIFNEVIEKCEKHGLKFLSFDAYTGVYMLTVHDVKLAGIKPKLENMRDNIDYKLALDAWYRRGSIIIAADDSPFGCLSLAIDYLDKLSE